MGDACLIKALFSPGIVLYPYIIRKTEKKKQKTKQNEKQQQQQQKKKTTSLRSSTMTYR